MFLVIRKTKLKDLNNSGNIPFYSVGLIMKTGYPTDYDNYMYKHFIACDYYVVRFLLCRLAFIIYEKISILTHLIVIGKISFVFLTPLTNLYLLR